MLTGILKEFLEVVAHQVIYIRKVYDSKTFQEKQFCHTFVHKNRHPGVASYIKRSVEALHECLERSGLEAFHVVIFDAHYKPVERTSLSFKALELDRLGRRDISNLEKMFQMLLRNLTTRNAILADPPEGASFEIIVRTKGTKPNMDVWCEELAADFCLQPPLVQTPVKSLSYGNALAVQLSFEKME